MAQTILNDEAGEALHHLATDIDAALRYLPDGGIDRAHVERWRDDLKKVMEGRVTHPRTRGPSKKKLANESATA